MSARLAYFSYRGYARQFGGILLRGPLVAYEEFCEDEWIEWYDLSPAERWAESSKLWQTYLALGGSIDPAPDTQVLSTIQRHGVQALLMGGQACVLYGAAEFSRDTDLAVLIEPKNLAALGEALADLKAKRIAVPPFETKYLESGFAIHFRCFHADAMKQRVDVMARMRGVDPFDQLWKRRAILKDRDRNVFEVLSLPDLVQSKKTQRDKDWPMIRRLLEKDYRDRRENPSELDLQFWFLELRTPALLTELARDFPARCASLSEIRPLLKYPGHAEETQIERALFEEEWAERQRDREYWMPLKKELEKLRREAGED